LSYQREFNIEILKEKLEEVKTVETRGSLFSYFWKSNETKIDKIPELLDNKRYKKTLRPTSEQLETFNLK